MSWLSSAIRRNSKAIQSIVKPLVSHVPLVGGVVADRMLMSPTPAQANAIETTSAAVSQVAKAGAAVQAEQATTIAPTPVAVSPPVTAVPPGTAPPGSVSQKTLLIVGGVALVALLLVVLASGRR